MEAIEHSYGCHLDEAPCVSLYFARISRSWKGELAEFVTRLDATWLGLRLGAFLSRCCGGQDQ